MAPQRECELYQTQMGEDTVITEAPGVESGAETNAGVLSEADLAASFVERVETDEETAPESEA